MGQGQGEGGQCPQNRGTSAPCHPPLPSSWNRPAPSSDSHGVAAPPRGISAVPPPAGARLECGAFHRAPAPLRACLATPSICKAGEGAGPRAGRAWGLGSRERSRQPVTVASRQGHLNTGLCGHHGYSSNIWVAGHRVGPFQQRGSFPASGEALHLASKATTDEAPPDARCSTQRITRALFNPRQVSSTALDNSGQEAQRTQVGCSRVRRAGI